VGFFPDHQPGLPLDPVARASRYRPLCDLCSDDQDGAKRLALVPQVPRPAFHPEFLEPNLFNTLAEGISAVPYGGYPNIKTGSSSETPTITKHMTIQAYNGVVTIGR
jgi:hypothetical protein